MENVKKKIEDLIARVKTAMEKAIKKDELQVIPPLVNTEIQLINMLSQVEAHIAAKNKSFVGNPSKDQPVQ